ncbi:MAG TPA: SDR family NAD(P)-dependent oxidoreductase, partial [Phenylobacterium sp.]|uniref:SDR family NAD(P)-dependent oxidoreductase n=1 Tax=Phenylobacterium sp. TaxID=1871053 RepID=UPI002D72B30B
MGASLQGQVAVVTGASGGLGEHFARVLAAEGAAVALTARRLDKVEAVAAELAGQGHRAVALRLDVAEAERIAPVFDEIETALGPISILINNAGVSGDGMAL